MKKCNETYSKTRGEEPFDWNKFLARKRINSEQWLDAANLAGSWVTCACGNQCKIIPRDIDGEPKNPLLRRLGTRFYHDIQDEDKAGARATLKRIEAQSAIVIKRILDRRKRK
jgi:hypothetical protein